MRVFVLGATGNVGSSVVERLRTVPAIREVVAAARREPSATESRVTWRHLDLRHDLPDDLFEGIDVVIHLAWLMQPSRAPRTTWDTNVRGTERVLRAVARAGVPRLVYASSVGAYSPRRGIDPVAETWPTHGVPTSAYSREKAYVERLLDIFEREHPATRVVRMRPAFTFAAKAAVQQRRLFGGPLVPGASIAKGRLPLLPDPGEVLLQGVHAEDVASAYHLATVAAHAEGAYNLAADGALELPDLAVLLAARVVRVPAAVARAGLHAAWSARLTPTSPGLFDLVRQVPMMTAERARRDLGWEPHWSTHDAVADLLTGLRRGSGAATPPLDPATSGAMRSHEVRTSLLDQP